MYNAAYWSSSLDRDASSTWSCQTGVFLGTRVLEYSSEHAASMRQGVSIEVSQVKCTSDKRDGRPATSDESFPKQQNCRSCSPLPAVFARILNTSDGADVRDQDVDGCDQSHNDMGCPWHRIRECGAVSAKYMAFVVRISDR